MAILKSLAVVLRNRDFKETSFIVSLYTRDFGKIRGIAKGARRSPPKFASAFMPFSLNEILFYERKNDGLSVIAQCELLENFQGLREDLTRLAYAAYFIELLDSFTSPGDKNELLFELLVSSLRLLERTGNPRTLARVVEVKMLDLSGFRPQINFCVHCNRKTKVRAYFSTKLGGLLCQRCYKQDSGASLLLPGTIASLEHIQRTEMGRAARLDFIGDVADELGGILHKFLDYHLDYRLKSRVFLEKIKAA